MSHHPSSTCDDGLVLAVAEELSLVADALCRLACVLVSDADLAQRHITDLQALDLITQTQRSLADVLRQEGPIEARLGSISLEALALRLEERLRAQLSIAA